MSERPSDIPQDVWDVACRLWAEMRSIKHPVSDSDAEGDVEEIARAILAERSKVVAAGVRVPHHGDINS